MRVDSVCTCVVEAFCTSSASTKASSIVRPKSKTNRLSLRPAGAPEASLTAPDHAPQAARALTSLGQPAACGSRWPAIR
eukprot:scaffold29574_cov48-Phaeocystis_antarctica.AAC.1